MGEVTDLRARAERLDEGIDLIRELWAGRRSSEAGCTWWLETRWQMPHHTADRMRQVRQRLAAGPPAVPGQAAKDI